MGMNWAGFQGLGQGFETGMRIGNAIKGASRESKLNDIREQGIAEAKAAQQKDVEGSVMENGLGGTPATAATAPTSAPAPQIDMAATAAPAPGVPMTSGPQDQNAMVPPELAAPAAASAAPPAPPLAIEPPAAAGVSTPKKRFSVGDMGFDTREEALAHARKSSAPLMDYMAKTMVPKMQEALVAQGDIEKAEAWGKWATDKKSERHMLNWANAKRAADLGDFEGAASHLGKLYKDYDDGMSVEGQEPVKDKDGKLTGFNLKIKNDATGETRVQFVDPPTLVNMGLTALSPPAMFEMAQKQQMAASQLKAKAAIDAQNDARTAVREENRDIRKDTRQEAADIRRENREGKKLEQQHGYKLEEMATEADMKEAGVGRQERAKIQSKIDILKESGMAPEAIKELLPHMVGGDGYKKSTSPEEARRLLLTERVKDPMFSRKTPAEQKAIIDQDMTTVYGAPAAKAAPAAGGAAPKKGTPYLKPDGTVEYR